MTAAALSASRRKPTDPRQIERCLLLAALLHVWLVLVFGNATGAAAPGQGVWGSLTVKLLGRSGSDAEAPPGQMPAITSTAATSVETGAAKQGRHNPREVPPEAARSDEPSEAPPSTATLELPEGFQPLEREKLDAPPPPRRLTTSESPVLPLTPADLQRLPQTAPLQSPAPELPPTVGRLEARPEPQVAPLQPPPQLRAPAPSLQVPALPAELPAAVRRLEPDAVTPTTSATLPRPAELRVVPARATLPPPAADLPAAVNRLEAPVDNRATPSLPRPADLRATPAASAQVLPGAALPAPVRRLEAPPAVEAGDAVTPLPSPAELRTRVAAPTALPSSQDLPAAVNRLESGDTPDVRALQPAQSPRLTTTAPAATAMPELSTALPGEVAAPASVAGPARGDPKADPYAAPKAASGSPDAGPRLGPDVPPPPTAAASAPRAPLNLSLPRGDMTARRGIGLIDLVPPPPERKSKLEQSLEEAANKDCRKAYSGAGILAAVPLAIDAARGKGCKW